MRAISYPRRSGLQSSLDWLGLTMHLETRNGLRALRHLLIFTSSFLASLCLGQSIPLSDPRPYESRPAWWLSCWAGHVVVIKGTLRFEIHDQPDVTVRLSPAAAATVSHDVAEKRLTDKLVYEVGTVMVDQLIFASPGIELLDTPIAAMNKGDVRSILVLVPCLQGKHEDPVSLRIKPGVDNRGVFIFQRRGLLPGIPLAFDEQIPDDKLQDAMAMFEYRKKYDYHQRPLGQ
jgi:hypothetical protein